MIDYLPTADDVAHAAARLAGHILNTPCVESRTLAAITGAARLHLKFENLQFTASFKERGALNKLLTLTQDQREAGVCAMSAGNHAQGLAYHAKRLGIPATIVMPNGTPMTKIGRTRDHGATVIVDGDNLSEALTRAEDIAARQSLTFVHPFDDSAVIAGQGTIAEEMLQAIPDLDVLVVPIGGGGLISGIAIAAKAINPAIHILGVQSAIYPSMGYALDGEPAPVQGGLTIAEGIAVKSAGQLTRQIVRTHVDEVLLVEESAIEQAVALLLSVEKTVVEGAGAAGLAAILQHRGHFVGRKAATILTGGNIDLRVLASVAMRELVRQGQLLRFAVPISDQPGATARLTTILGERGANIVDIAHDRLSLALNPKGAVLTVVAEVQDRAHGEAILCQLRADGFDAVAAPL